MTASSELEPITAQEDTDLALPDRFEYYFERAGATTEVREEYRDEYLLDFIVTGLQDVHAHVNLGIHVTSDQDALDQQQAFLKASEHGVEPGQFLEVEVVDENGVVLKSAYVELSDVTSNSGGLLVGFGACMSFLFNQRFSNRESTGIQVKENCTFNFFELEENIERLERMSMDDDLAVGEEMTGRIVAYFTDKGFGFIQTGEERKFFFHIANVIDDDLRAKLPSYTPGQTIDVAFEYGGHDGKKYPKAVNVALEA
ncbi:MAG: cold-shock protein [Bradymonadaceae bacterium]